MSLQHVQADEKTIRLMSQIGQVIQSFTMTSPMLAEDVIGVLGFCAGSAIASAPPQHTKGELRQMAIANLDHGLSAFLSQPRGLILPS